MKRGHWGRGVKGVFDTKVDSGYDDDIARRYHFPKVYREVADSLVGAWIVYREPQRNRGRRAYVAAARVARIEDDPERAGHAYAYMTDYLRFDRPVPLVTDGRYAEASLRAIGDPTRIGRSLQGKSIRTLSEEDFAAIVRGGFAETLAPENAIRLELSEGRVDEETRALLNAPATEQERRIEQILMNRKIRDASFRRQVCEAYENTCAITRLQIINGFGRSEAQAAHILPVAEGRA
jgi:putative restriction endonuclease